MFPPSPFISSDMFLLSFAWILFMDAVNPYGFNDVLGCQRGYYGENCENKCSEYCYVPRRCDGVTGQCYEGCKPGWYTKTCEQKCPFGTFGNNCRQECGYCLEKDHCHHINGSCLNGCLEGYRGKPCKHQCEIGYYGKNCNNKCSRYCSVPRRCDRVTGHCFGGCQPGWYTKACEQTRYGAKSKINHDQRQHGLCLQRLPCSSSHQHKYRGKDVSCDLLIYFFKTSNQDSTENPTVDHFSETSIDMPKIPSSTSHPPSSSQSHELCGSNLCQSLKSALICLAVIFFTVIVVMVIGLMKMRRKLQFQKRQIQEQQELQQLPSDQDSPNIQFSEFLNTTFA